MRIANHLTGPCQSECPASPGNLIGAGKVTAQCERDTDLQLSTRSSHWIRRPLDRRCAQTRWDAGLATDGVTLSGRQAERTFELSLRWLHLKQACLLDGRLGQPLTGRKAWIRSHFSALCCWA